MYEIIPDDLKGFIIDRGVTQYEIFRYYLGKSEGKIKCIFHTDDDPSLSISPDFGRYGHFRCFGCGVHGNAFDLVAQIHNIPYREACKQIINDFGIGSFHVDKSGRYIPSERIITQCNHHSDIEIRVQSQKFTDVDVAYWKQYYFTGEIIKKFNIYSAFKIWKTDKHTDDLELFNVYRKKDPVFAYYFNNDTFKIYFPFRNKNRFIGNAKKDTIQGWDQLPLKGKLCFITSSLKDVGFLYRIGFTSVAPQSENTIIPLDKISELKERFDQVVIFYNNDDQGVRSGIEHSEIYNLPYTHIPTGYSKDPSDFGKDNGLEQSIKLIKELKWIYRK